MEQYFAEIISSTVIFLLIIISGLYLRFKGKPYSKLVLALHKISSLAAIAIMSLLLLSILKDESDSPDLSIKSLVCAVLGLISFVSGVLQSFDKAAHKVVVISHKVTSYFLILFIIYILTSHFI